jgi:hypothetical protein
MPARQAQYGPSPGSFLAPQKRKSGWAGSPIGQRHIDSRNSTMVTGSDIGTTTSLTVWESIYKCTAYLSAEALADGVTKMPIGQLWGGGRLVDLLKSSLSPERGEDAAKAAYEAALQKSSPANARTLIGWARWADPRSAARREPGSVAQG